MLKLLIFSLMLEGGYQPGDYTLILNDSLRHAEFGKDNTWYFQFSPKIEFGPVYLKGGILTETDFAGSSSQLYGQPYQTQYDVEIGLTIKNITLGASHMCAHSTFIPEELFNQQPSMDDSYTRIFARFELSTHAIQ